MAASWSSTCWLHVPVPAPGAVDAVAIVWTETREHSFAEAEQMQQQKRGSPTSLVQSSLRLCCSDSSGCIRGRVISDSGPEAGVVSSLSSFPTAIENEDWLCRGVKVAFFCQFTGVLRRILPIF